MKIKLELGEKKYEGEVEDVCELLKILVKAYAEPEVFLKKEGEKCWLQNPATAVEYAGKDWIQKIERMPLDELNERYPTGDTLNALGEPKRARNIYYPKAVKAYMFKGMRALLTLNPKPTNGQIMKDLGFNTLIPYAGSVSGWDGDEMRTSPGKQVKYMFTGDEPDCNKKDPQAELRKLQRMKEDNPGIPVGFCLCQAIGCGHSYCGGVQETIDAWMEVANQADFVMCGVYPYRKGVDDPAWDVNAKWKRYYSKLTVPFLALLQAHWWDEPNEKGRQVYRPEVMEQLEPWFERAQEGYENISGYGVYCWADKWHGVRDMQEEWKAANEWAARRTE